MEHTGYWPRAFGISCITHFLIFAFLGLLAGQVNIQQSPAEYIMVDLSLSPHIQGGGHSALKPAGAVTTTAPAQSEPMPPIPTVLKTPPVQSEISQPRQVSDTGLVAAPNGDLRIASGPPPNARAAAALTGDGTTGSVGSGELTSGAGSGSGAGTGIGPGVGAGSGPGIDSAILAFLTEIEKRKEYPYIARKRGHEGVVTLIVELSAAGDLSRVQIAQSSGSSQLDDAAASAIRRVCPFAHGLGRPVGMKIPISYRLVH